MHVVVNDFATDYGERGFHVLDLLIGHFLWIKKVRAQYSQNRPASPLTW